MEMEIKTKIIRTRASHFRAAQVLKKKGEKKAHLINPLQSKPRKVLYELKKRKCRRQNKGNWSEPSEKWN